MLAELDSQAGNDMSRPSNPRERPLAAIEGEDDHPMRRRLPRARDILDRTKGYDGAGLRWVAGGERVEYGLKVLGKHAVRSWGGLFE
ncbi:hypothetical protein DW322_07950 [Rhodococcus rhodnii]|uniref:Uncharacterized protein n=1 Tax=Rhodococcus rhodnii TaxID=38312 RepID=A0A6P2CBL8_9NOCA|nr:hypothetical protein DW322_07950 [Rhodococcus rhodnii]